MSAGVASDYAQLAFHALALVPLVGPGRMDDARYLAWARANLGAGAIGPFLDDARLIAGRLPRPEDTSALAWLPLLHESIDALVRAARAELPALAPSPAKRALSAIDAVGVELLHADLALAARDYRSALPEVRGRCERSASLIGEHLDQARALSPALRERRVEIAWALGPRGRGFAGVIFVGAPDDWSGLRPEVAAAIALHEAHVCKIGGGYFEAEWGAIDELVELTRGTAIGEAYLTWLRSLDLTPLLLQASLRGHPTDELAARLGYER
ncbi:MAG: hypothetical protein IT378_17100 [Sandaracinaceae bacterium]|nr:hypothetical protein [Sandaracinaceae bacterium]